MSSKAGSKTPQAEAVRRAAVVTHGRPETIGEGLARLQAAAEQAGVELTYSAEEAEKHAVDAGGEQDVDLTVVLGGDGTMLRALRGSLATRVPVVGVNFGSVGFLTSIAEPELAEGLARVFAGEYVVVELPTLEAEVGGERHVAVNDVVAASSVIGRMVQLAWSIGGEELGVQPCDGLICSTPSGSTAYNLSNGGPVLVWGIDAMTLTFIAPHALDARPLVVPRNRELAVENRTIDVPVAVLVDGRPAGELAEGERAVVRLGAEHSLLAVLPEATFFRRYRETFAS
jgi:NAD+ kinase